MKNKPPSEKDQGMKKKIIAVFTAGFGLLVMLTGCLPPKQVISGYEDPAKRIQTEPVRKSGDRTAEAKKAEDQKMEALIRKLEEAEQRLREMERKNQETLRRLEDASQKTERSMERIEKAGEKIEALGRKEVP
jgi:Skp family chaperone for outer membrane proteins